jgi:rubrerythrin
MKTDKHVHGVYSDPRFGFKDEGEAVKDYHVLDDHLKSPKAKKMLKEIIGEERQHRKEFRTIIRLEKAEAKKKH